VARFTSKANLVALFRDLDAREKWKNVNISLAERDGDRYVFLLAVHFLILFN
jgi:predicted component of type VI protein secretion system